MARGHPGEGDELNVDPDGEVVLEFGDNSRVTVEQTTQLKIASFFTEGGIVKTELLLKVGQVAASVNRSETTRSDMRIRSPSAAVSVRGTEFATAYDATTRVTKLTVTEGEVEAQRLRLHDPYVDVEVPRGKPFVLAAGQEVQVSPTAVGTVAAVGLSTPPQARAAITRATAISKVRGILRRNAGSCDLRTKSVTARVIVNGFRVRARVTLDGGDPRNAVWKITGKTPKAQNGLARRIQRGCP